jgi:hypothetical protein
MIRPRRQPATANDVLTLIKPLGQNLRTPGICSPKESGYAGTRTGIHSRQPVSEQLVEKSLNPGFAKYMVTIPRFRRFQVSSLSTVPWRVLAGVLCLLRRSFQIWHLLLLPRDLFRTFVHKSRMAGGCNWTSMPGDNVSQTVMNEVGRKPFESEWELIKQGPSCRELEPGE